MKLTGFFISNAFLDSPAVTSMANSFVASAEKENIELLPVTNADMLISCSPDGLECRHNIQADFAIFYDKDLRLAQALEFMGLRLFNTASALEACDDKSLTHIKLSLAKIPQPKTIIVPKTFERIGYTDLSFTQYAADTLGFPIVVKERYGSWGQQVYLAKDQIELTKIIKGLNGRELIFQEYIGTGFGRDMRVNIVGGKCVASILRTSENDFRSNIALSNHAESITPTKEECALAIKCCETLGLDFAGVDILWKQDSTPIVCEVNSNAHTLGTQACTGVNVAEHIIRHIKEKLK